MASRAELNLRAAALGINQATYPNDSSLEQEVLYAETNATAFTGTIGTTTLTSNATTVSNLDTVTIGSRTYTFKTALTEAAASSTLTSNATIPNDGDRVNIEGFSYTFRTALSVPNVAGEVLINASAANALINLKKAINASGTAGTDYGVGTVIHPKVTAGTITATTLVITAKATGVLGNAFLTSVSATATTLSWTGASLSGGANPVANEVLIGASAATNLSNLSAALSGGATAGVNYSSNTAPNVQVVPSTLTSTTLVINAADNSVTNGSLATTKSATNLSFTGAVMGSGVAAVVAPDATSVHAMAGGAKR